MKVKEDKLKTFKYRVIPALCQRPGKGDTLETVKRSVLASGSGGEEGMTRVKHGRFLGQ